MSAPVRVTPEAARLLVESLEEHAYPEDAVRVSVASGGRRSGLQYGIDFDPEIWLDDVVIELPGGRTLVIDSWSAELMAGVTIDAAPVASDPEGRLGFWFRRGSPGVTLGVGRGDSRRFTFA